jgi:hypothetical protein
VTALEVLNVVHRAGLQVRAHGDRLRIRPAAKMTPELKDMLMKHKADILDALKPAYVTLQPDARTGQVLTLPVEALRLAWSLEARGVELHVDADHQLVVPHGARLTDDDRRGIARWHLHLAAIVEYEVPHA